MIPVLVFCGASSTQNQSQLLAKLALKHQELHLEVENDAMLFYRSVNIASLCGEYDVVLYEMDRHKLS